ncbi:hypothetical protein LIT25_12435 [Bacillus sp. F19]|nr:hypothetical protein LIT25_12435 [Bacillus sp. F19]
MILQVSLLRKKDTLILLVKTTVEVGDVTTYTFNPVKTGQFYFLLIRAMYVNKGNVFYATMQESPTVATEQKPLW